MERPPSNNNVIVAEAQQAIAECVITELELGLTFLDVAETTSDRKHARQSVHNAIIALRTADRFLSEIPRSFNVDAIKQRRKRLAERLHSITDANDSR